mmetsp:Transcript_33906/g.74672  ORF Transcript_33906/g.74672 Transcript_33906/m.74672 type:complete len:552 (-) Transcript_33906:1013-2668(-)
MSQAKKISQETFDEVVRENVEDFEMGDAEALADAIDQFNKQGVDMSAIDSSGGVGREEIMEAIKELERCSKDASAGSAATLAALEGVAALCDKAHAMQARNRLFMLSQGGVNALHVLFDDKQEEGVLVRTMHLLDDLSRSSVDTRDFFEPGGSERLCMIVRALCGDQPQSAPAKPLTLLAALSLARTVVKSENNKNSMMRAGMDKLLTEIVVHNSKSVAGWAAVLEEGCQLMRGLCLHDDLRRDMSCAYENGRYFIKQQGVVGALMGLSCEFRLHDGLASAALLAARNMITTEEAVAVMAHHGAIELIRSILSHPNASVSLVRSAAGLMRNVCADDVRKDRLVGDGSLDLLVAVMSREEYAKDGGLVEHAVACLAQISLRSPSNSQRIVSAGNALDILAQAMRRYSDRSGLQRQGALTIRNIAARCPELRPALLDAGFEDILRAAGRMQDAVDEAYGALRDLECEVHYVKINAEGRAEPMYEQFGAQAATGKPLQFNPIWDDDGDIEQRVADEARAPMPNAINRRSPPLPPLEEEEEEAERAHVHGADCHH